MNKYQAYKKRCKDAGKCTHCGKPCAPFIECQERRDYKNELRRRKSLFHRKANSKNCLPRGLRRLWTKQEDDNLKIAWQQNISFKEICQSFDRPPWGIFARARRLGFEKFNELQPLLRVLESL